MKRLVFAAVAALAMASVSNVFAGKNATTYTTTVSADTIAPNDTVAPSPADTVAPATADTIVAK